MTVALENVSIAEVCFIGSYDEARLVRAILTVDQTDYECAEYVADGVVNDTADSQMRVNGIYNLDSRRNEPFVARDMDEEDYIRWAAIENFVRREMQVFVDSQFVEAA